MDPLSLLAGIAGVATAGIQVSKAIYDLVSTIRGTPKEISDIARGVSDLSIVLSELRRALREGSKLYRRKLLRRVNSAIRRIDKIHAQINDMIAGVTGFASLKWMFRRSKTTHLLYQIESHKNGINMVLHIMTLAVQTRALAGGISDSSGLPPDGDGQDEKAERDLMRQHAENLVQVSYQSLRDAMDGVGKHAETFETDQADEAVSEPHETQSTQLELWKEAPEKDDTTQWLYELVFSSYAESRSGLPSTSKPLDNETEVKRPVETDSASNEERALLVGNTPENMQLAAITQKPVEVSSVVDELLAEWTTLTEDEIAGVAEKRPGGSKPNVGVIKFKDAVGRKFSFPYHLAQTWVGIETLINQAFLHVPIVGPQVQKGRYDIIMVSTGDIILPSAWEHVIQPGDAVTMSMWPIDKPPLPGPPPHYARKQAPSIRKQSPAGSEGTATMPGVQSGGIDSKQQVELDKATFNSSHQSHVKGQLRDEKRRRAGRNRDIWRL